MIAFIGSSPLSQKANLGIFLLLVFLANQPGFSYHLEQDSFQLSQFTPLTFDSWRPHNNPNKLVQVGMNKGEVIAVAGKPDYEESYYQRSRGHLTRISDWYYVRTGWNHETALLKFSGASLIRISVTQTQ